MITTPSRSLARFPHRRALAGLTALSFLALVPDLPAQTDNFNSGSLSPYWQHYDSGSVINHYTGLTMFNGSYTLPSDGAGGHAFRIAVPGDTPFDTTSNPTGANLGPGRALAFRADGTYGARFSLGVDVIAWNNAIDQAFGPYWYLNPSTVGPGTSVGYAMTWEATTGDIRISRIDGETPATVANGPNTPLTPGQHYRFLVSSHDGATYLAQIFNDNDLLNPIAGAVAIDTAHLGGWMGLLSYDGTSPSTTGADVTYDNYSASAPGANTLRTTVAHLYPAPLQKVTALYPTITVGILDRDTQVDTGNILLWLDGALLSAADVVISAPLVESANPNSAPKNFGGAMVNYTVPTLLPWNSLHTNTIAFADVNGAWTTNTWTWTAYYPMLHATNSLPLGSLSLPGWNVRMVWTNGATLGNSLARAEKQLATPPTIPYMLTTQMVSQVLNWNDAGDGTTAQMFGHFYDPSLVSGVPGLPPDGSHDNIAVESFAYLQLTAGVHRFGAVSDDGFQVRSGYGLRDTNATVMGVKDGGTFDNTFDFAVEADGLYPVRCLWYENGGSADFQLFSVDLNDPNARVLINDPNAPAGVVAAYLPIRLLSADSVGGPYATETAAVIDTLAQTVTVPASGAARFYRMQTLNAVRLTSLTPAGANIVIHYQ